MKTAKLKSLINAIYGVNHNAKKLRARLLALHLVRLSDKLIEFWNSETADVYSLCEMLKTVPEVDLLLDVLPEYRNRLEEIYIHDALYGDSDVTLDMDLEEYYTAYRLIVERDTEGDEPIDWANVFEGAKR